MTAKGISGFAWPGSSRKVRRRRCRRRACAALSYAYEVVLAEAPFVVGERILVAHLDADADDPGFRPGRMRRLELDTDLPGSATLLHGQATRDDPAQIWFCPRSDAAVEPHPTEGLP